MARSFGTACDELEHYLDSHAPADENGSVGSDGVEHALEVLGMSRHVHAVDGLAGAGPVKAAIVPGHDAKAPTEMRDLVPKRSYRPSETVGEQEHWPFCSRPVVSDRRRTASRREPKLLHEENSTGSEREYQVALAGVRSEKVVCRPSIKAARLSGV
jgi:hypothetical protein